MFNLIIEISSLIWTTSAMFMLYFSVHEFVLSLAMDEPRPHFSFIKFIYYHFCPVINTYKCYTTIKSLL